MKQLTAKTLIVLLVGSSSFFTSCKRGENDPLISLRTRKNRVVGDWKLTSGRYSTASQYPGAGPEGESFEYTSTTFTYILDIADSVYSPSATGSYSRTIKFGRDGKFISQENIDGFLYVINGTWDFNTGVGKAKNRQYIHVHVSSYKTTSGNYTYGGNQTDYTYEITELRNKKMALFYKQTLLKPDGSTKKVMETMVLEQ